MNIEALEREHGEQVVEHLSQALHMPVVTPDEMSATAPQLGDRHESPLQELEARELGGAIEHAIARLRPEYRTCILLRHVEGHSYEDIARILDLPLGTVKTYIHRARNELRGYLEDRRE